MGKILDYINSVFGSKAIIHTPNGTLNLAKSRDRDKARRLIAELLQTTDALTRRDIASWRQAWQLAINVEEPSRRYLLDIYRDVDADGHVTGCIGQRKGFVKAKSFKLTQPDGTADKEALKYFDTIWFKQLMDYVLDSRYWGYSLIQLGDVITLPNGILGFDGVELINRKHVIPEHHVVVRCQGDSWRTGIDYHQAPWNDYLIEAGDPHDLGLYLKAALHTIPKKNDLAFWDTFAEMFGMPMRVAKTISRDENDIRKIERMMDTMGAEGYAVLPEGTEVDIKESSRTDSYNVYDKRVERANSELSKLLIGQTMTIDDGSSLSQSQTHLSVFENLVDQDADNFRDIVNNQLLPKMIMHGFPLQGLTFDWDESTDYTPEQQVAYETMLLDNFEVDPQYFIDKYNIPVGDRRTLTLSSQSSPHTQASRHAVAFNHPVPNHAQASSHAQASTQSSPQHPFFD